MFLDPSIYVSLAFLFGIAAQFRSMDGDLSLRRLMVIFERRVGVLFAVVIITALFSPLILNDVVVLILTPVLVRYSKQFKVDIALLLVAEISFTNIASSLTPLGNPQNILLLEATGISATKFVSGTWLPLALSGLLVAAILFSLRHRLDGPRELPASVGAPLPLVYLGVVAAVVFALDLFGVPTVYALGLAFLLGIPFNLRSLRRVAKEYDIRSMLTLFLLVGSISVIALALRPVLSPAAAPAAAGVQPYSAVFVGVVSNAISNVPATQLLLSTSTVPASVAPRIAVEAGLAGNIDPIASFANLLALLMVRRAGLPIRRAVMLQIVVGTVSFIPALL